MLNFDGEIFIARANSCLLPKCSANRSTISLNRFATAESSVVFTILSPFSEPTIKNKLIVVNSLRFSEKTFVFLVENVYFCGGYFY
jgi:hypothetical protein